MVEGPAAAEDASLVAVAVEPGERKHVLAREMAVVIDERLLALDAQAGEEVPQLAGVRDHAARVIDEIGDVAVDRLFGVLDELLGAPHPRVSAHLLGPFAHLAGKGEGPPRRLPVAR